MKFSPEQGRGRGGMDCIHSLISDLAIIASGSVLLVKYEDMAKYDDEPGWFLPDDVLRDFEHPTRAAARIASEQLGLELDEIGLQHIESFRGNDGTWHMSFHHLCELASVPRLKPGVGVADVQWFSLNQLPPRSEVAHRGWALSVLKKMTLPTSW
jgi:ADP-ribose pyrophosphatase YjhB (NUDIX family)